jgi:hypothetical protein
MEQQEKKLLRNARRWIALFMAGLAVSGITAFPIETELAFLARHAGALPPFVRPWIVEVHAAVADVNATYPFLSYGTDWLAFAHLVIAMAFIGAYRDPVRNRWLLDFGIMACLAVVPLALIAGPVRGIPFAWRMIDCSFGVFGLVPLLMARRLVDRLEKMSRASGAADS